MAERDQKLLAVSRASIGRAKDRSVFGDSDCCAAVGPGWVNAFLADRLRLHPEVWEVFLRRLVVRRIVDLRSEIEIVAAKRCESPIEELLFLSLLLAASGIAEADTILDGRDPSEDDGYDGFSIQPQATVGKYRIDFKVSYGTAQLLRSGNDETADEWAWHVGSVLVECDGHDFHERTKEQASHDRRKDRALQDAGFKVFRYTGSDVWKDCMTAAHEIADQARKLATTTPPVKTWTSTKPKHRF